MSDLTTDIHALDAQACASNETVISSQSVSIVVEFAPQSSKKERVRIQCAIKLIVVDQGNKDPVWNLACGWEEFVVEPVASCRDCLDFRTRSK